MTSDFPYPMGWDYFLKWQIIVFSSNISQSSCISTDLNHSWYGEERYETYYYFAKLVVKVN